MKPVISLLSLLLLAQSGIGQKMHSNLAESHMKISGTSTLHDWESDVEQFSATCTVKNGNIVDASFEADVKSIKSGTTAMDKNTYKAMNAEQYPKITFASSSISTDANRLDVTGKLTIAGKSETIRMELNREKWSEESFTVSGSYKLKMSDYGIDPPRALMGTIKTGDEVTIKFNIILYE